ncbi:MAG TPA: regulatory protein RecX [Propionibacteriaceae bacterium]
MARGVVLRKLTAQSRTRHELDQALRAKDVPDDVAQEVLDRMEEVGLVDDATFAHDWVESRQQRRQLSRSALRRELQTKGVDRDHIDEALATVDVDDEYQAARALAERRAHSMAGLPRDVAYRRLAGVLARRGFNGELCGRVLAEVLADHRR